MSRCRRTFLPGRHLCSRRYREFSSLHHQLKQEFPDFPFNSLPKKWPFKLSDQQLDARRRGLEQYLDKSNACFPYERESRQHRSFLLVCSVRVVGDCDLVQEFLSADVYEVNSIDSMALRRTLSPRSAIRFRSTSKSRSCCPTDPSRC